MKVPHLSQSEIDDRLAAGMVRVLYGKLLNTIDGEDSDREGLKDTPNTPNTCLLYTSPSPRD